jgi:hypothetical protein
MLELRAAARRIGGLNAALACLAVLTGCGSVAGTAGTASAVRSPGAVAGPASDAGVAGHARTGSAGSPPVGPPAAKANLKHFDFLNGVSCASAANCTAVGDYYRTAAGPQVTLVERWNGTAWRIEPSPGTGRGSTLDSVSCPSATSCTAVGSSDHRLERRELEGRAAVQPVRQRVLRGAGLMHGRRGHERRPAGVGVLRWHKLDAGADAPAGAPGAEHHAGRSLLRRAELLPGGRGLLLRRGRHAQPHRSGQDPRRAMERIVLAGHRLGRRGELEPAQRGLVHITARVHRGRQQRVGAVHARRALGRLHMDHPAGARREPDRSQVFQPDTHAVRPSACFRGARERPYHSSSRTPMAAPD